MPGWASPARPAVYKPPAGAQVASPQSPILRRSRSRLSELHHQTRGADKSPLLIARLLLLTRLSPFARPATPFLLPALVSPTAPACLGYKRFQLRHLRRCRPLLTCLFRRNSSTTRNLHLTTTHGPCMVLVWSYYASPVW